MGIPRRRTTFSGAARCSRRRASRIRALPSIRCRSSRNASRSARWVPEAQSPRRRTSSGSSWEPLRELVRQPCCRSDFMPRLIPPSVCRRGAPLVGPLLAEAAPLVLRAPPAPTGRPLNPHPSSQASGSLIGPQRPESTSTLRHQPERRSSGVRVDSQPRRDRPRQPEQIRLDLPWRVHNQQPATFHAQFRRFSCNP